MMSRVRDLVQLVEASCQKVEPDRLSAMPMGNCETRRCIAKDLINSGQAHNPRNALMYPPVQCKWGTWSVNPAYRHDVLRVSVVVPGGSRDVGGCRLMVCELNLKYRMMRYKELWVRCRVDSFTLSG